MPDAPSSLPPGPTDGRGNGFRRSTFPVFPPAVAVSRRMDPPATGAGSRRAESLTSGDGRRRNQTYQVIGFSRNARVWEVVSREGIEPSTRRLRVVSEPFSESREFPKELARSRCSAAA